MAPIGLNQLRRLALGAVEEASAAAHLGPVPYLRELALALAWLLINGKDGEPLPRWPFDSFWEALAKERQHDRWSAVNAAANAIYLALGEPQRPDVVSHLEARARARLSLQERRTLPPVS